MTIARQTIRNGNRWSKQKENRNKNLGEYYLLGRRFLSTQVKCRTLQQKHGHYGIQLAELPQSLTFTVNTQETGFLPQLHNHGRGYLRWPSIFILFYFCSFLEGLRDLNYIVLIAWHFLTIGYLALTFNSFAVKAVYTQPIYSQNRHHYMSDTEVHLLEWTT